MLDLSLEALGPHLIKQLPEHKTIENIKALNRAFIRREKEWQDYSSNPELVSAYSQLYLPTNLPKIRFLIKQLPQELLGELSSHLFIDVGCGPGTYSLGWLEQFPNGSVALVDKSQVMIEQAERFVQGFFPEADCQCGLAHIKNDKKILFFGNSLNEMGPQEGMELVAEVAPEYVFLIEPGTRESFSQVMSFRQKLMEQGYSCLYPCPGISSSCAMEGTEDWCHQVIHVTHDPSVERLCQILKLDRRTLPMCCHVYVRGPKSDKLKRSRVIRKLGEDKHSYTWQVCEAENRMQVVEMVKRGLSSREKKDEAVREPGTEIRYEILKTLPNGVLRVKKL